MSTTVVYGDLLFVTNFLMDLALLTAVSRFGNFTTCPARLLAGALLAAALSLILIIPSLAFFNSFWGKLALSLLIVKFTFPYQHKRRFLLAVAYFYLVSFAMAGAVLGVTFLLHDVGLGTVGYSYTAVGLSAALLCALLLCRWGAVFVKRTMREGGNSDVLEIITERGRVRLPALFDTGNELKDPLSGRPVVVVECPALKDLLPPEVSRALAEEKDDAAVFTTLQGSPCARRLRLLPYASIGTSCGLLLGFKPQCVRLLRRRITLTGVVLALYRGTIRTQDNCCCIVNPAILDTAV